MDYYVSVNDQYMYGREGIPECVTVCFIVYTVLQKHYRTLEALALEHEEAEEINDLTLPDCAHIEKRAGTAIDEFKQLVQPAGYDLSARPPKRKVANCHPYALKHRGS